MEAPALVHTGTADLEIDDTSPGPSIHDTSAFRVRMSRIRDLPFLARRFAVADHPLLAKAMRLEVFAGKELIVEQESFDDKFWIVEEGTAVVEVKEPDGKTIYPGILGKGEQFGMYSALYNEPRSSTVRAGPSGLSCISMRFGHLESLGVSMRSQRR